MDAARRAVQKAVYWIALLLRSPKAECLLFILNVCCPPSSPQIAPGMSVPAFLAAAEPLIMPLDAYFDKVFVMCEDEVRCWRWTACFAAVSLCCRSCWTPLTNEGEGFVRQGVRDVR